MQRWMMFCLLGLPMSCVHEVGEWPTSSSQDGSLIAPDETGEGSTANDHLDHTAQDIESEDNAEHAEDDLLDPADGQLNEDGMASPEGTTCSGDFCEWPADWVEMEREVLAQVNEVRRAGATCAGVLYPAVGELVWNENLAQAARAHSMDMGEQGYFSHDSLDGRSPWERMREAAFHGSPVAENIAAGSGTAAAVVQNWMNSPGHCRNILSNRATALGVGYAYVPASPYGHYWTQAFGAE